MLKQTIFDIAVAIKTLYTLLEHYKSTTNSLKWTKTQKYEIDKGKKIVLCGLHTK